MKPVKQEKHDNETNIWTAISRPNHGKRHITFDAFRRSQMCNCNNCWRTWKIVFEIERSKRILQLKRRENRKMISSLKQSLITNSWRTSHVNWCKKTHFDCFLHVNFNKFCMHRFSVSSELFVSSCHHLKVVNTCVCVSQNPHCDHQTERI